MCLFQMVFRHFRSYSRFDYFGDLSRSFAQGIIFLVQYIQNRRETGINPIVPVNHKILYHHMTFITDK